LARAAALVIDVGWKFSDRVIYDPELLNKDVRRSDCSGSPLQSSRDAGLADGLDTENSAAAASLFSGRC
jgi:hypothetical protein